MEEKWNEISQKAEKDRKEKIWDLKDQYTKVKTQVVEFLLKERSNRDEWTIKEIAVEKSPELNGRSLQIEKAQVPWAMTQRNIYTEVCHCEILKHEK